MNDRLRPRVSGQVLLLTLLLVMLVGMAGLFAFSAIALRESASVTANLDAKKVYFLAEGGVEDLMLRIRTGKQFSPQETVSLGGQNAVVSVSSAGSERVITSRGDIARAVRSVRVVLRAGTGYAFHYGILVGRGGFRMENTSRVVGSVYANGNITGKNFPEITGDAYAAGSSTITDFANIGGNAHAYSITGATVTGSATATNLIDDSSIGWNAYADTVTASDIGGKLAYCSFQSGNAIGVPPAVQLCPRPAALPEIELPISDAQIADWEAAAASGGTHTSPCPYVINTGTVTIGPRKINCDFTIQNDAVVTLTGPLWVSGNFKISNTAIIRLSPTYDNGSEVLIADNQANRLTSSKIIVQNAAQVLGSGEPASYLMLISMNNSAESGGTETAILPKNTADASIYYAPHGKILLENSTSLKEATAYLIEMKNSAELIYESGLADVNFSAGPSGGWEIESWNEVW